MNNRIDLHSAVGWLEMVLRLYYERRESDGEAAADSLRVRFSGGTNMLGILFGEASKNEPLRQLRAKGLKIPHPGDLMPDGGYSGYSSGFDMDFLD